MSLTDRPRFLRLLLLVAQRADLTIVARVRSAVGGLALLHGFEILLWLDLRRAAPNLPPIPYPSVPILGPPTATLQTVLFVFWTTAAFLFACGVWVRTMGLLLATLIGYILVCDQALTTNHGYLIFLEVALLTTATATRDGNSVAYWPIVLGKCLLSIVYGFAAASKLNGDFLAGNVLAVVLGHESVVPLPEVLLTQSFLQAIGVGLIVTELFLAFGLWFEITRRLATVIGIGLHLTAHLTFPFSFINELSFLQIGAGMLVLYPFFYVRPSLSQGATDPV